MDRFKTLSLTSRPLSPHALAWSCDAELAVATADCISIFLPEYALGREGTDQSSSSSSSSSNNNSNNININSGNANANSSNQDTSRHQFALSLQPSAIIQPSSAINARICARAQVGRGAPADAARGPFRGVGRGAIAGSGSALGQVVRVEWSPSGLGCNLRPVLAALATNGSVVALGEHVDRRRAAEASGTRARSFKNWKMLWGLGANLPVPDADCDAGYWRMDERVTAFSWARGVAPGRALCAYATDAGEVGVMSVQYHHPSPARRGDKEHESGGTPIQTDDAAAAAADDDDNDDDDVWDLKELGRFDAGGPHGTADSADPDFVPGGSIFSLRWSPWLVCDGYRTATIAYIAAHYVGFRRVTVYGDWERGEVPNIVVEDADTTGICLCLSSDASVEWEDAIWPEGDDAFVARGVIATPFVVKPFQVALNSVLAEPIKDHSPRECSSQYPGEDEASTNPITGLVIHPPDPRMKPEVPHYTAVRLSATPTNADWYQTNLPEHLAPLPQWAEDLGDQTARLVGRGAALEGVDSDFDSDSDDAEDSHAPSRPAGLQVHPHRFRLWGLALSPGGACSALLASRHSTQHPDRRGFCSVHFDWRVPDGRAAPTTTLTSTTATTSASTSTTVTTTPLTTEGRMWEWMYGMGDDVPGATSRRAARSTAGARSRILREQFRHVAIQLPCAFCGSKLHLQADKATCQSGHPFTSGVPIMAPGISRVCGVCGLRCLKVSELEKLAGAYALSAEGIAAAFGEVCGSCGGKFVV
ncbi:hypothetical protein ESCO_002896 [Escovopsis weberi]|uniref:Transcription factor IIIC putative zinc-finger domain-containing protein n=1 Tax=Escovopsis weberi TaxID=150374 RepID=A0A0M9VSD5_ESCWE|nr:hypothetical protein ESCO_002896 [Escovopsis weberi]